MSGYTLSAIAVLLAAALIASAFLGLLFVVGLVG